jgi:hypothetical protein
LGQNSAHAEEPTVDTAVVSPASTDSSPSPEFSPAPATDPGTTGETSTSTAQTTESPQQTNPPQTQPVLEAPTVTSVQEKIENATITLSGAISTASPAQQTAAEAPVAEANSAIQAAESATAVAIVAVQAVDSQTAVVATATTAVDSATAVVATATTNLSNAQADLTAAQTTLSTAPLIETETVVSTEPGLVVKVYNVQGQNNAPVLPQNATPIYTTVDTNGINENWGSGNVAGSNRSEDVIVTYEGQVTAPEGVNSIRFLVLSDDGARIYIDNQLVVNNWRDQGPTWSLASNWLDFTTDRTKDIAVWYYENGGGATLHLAWQHSGIHTGVGAEYLSHNETTSVTIQNPTLVAAVTAAEEVVTDKTQVKQAAEAELVTAQTTLTTETQTLGTLQSEKDTAVIAASQLATVAVEKANIAKTALEVPIPIPAPEPQPVPQPEPVNPEPVTPDPVVPDPGPSPEEPTTPDTPPETEDTDASDDAPDSTDDATDGASTDPSTGEPEQPIEEPQEPVEPEEPVVEPEAPVEEVEPPVEEEPQPELPEIEPENPLEESSPEPTTPEEEVDAAVEDALEDGVITEAEKEIIVDALLKSVKPGEALTAEAIAEAGIEYKDLPPETPVEVRRDENGNEVIITADVAAALVLLENPAELIGAIFSDPGEALQALGSIGADMSDEEREEAQEMVVAAVIAAGAAMNAVGAAAGAAGTSTGGSSGGGGGSSGGGGPSGDSKGVRRRKP